MSETMIVARLAEDRGAITAEMSWLDKTASTSPLLAAALDRYS